MDMKLDSAATARRRRMGAGGLALLGAVIATLAGAQAPADDGARRLTLEDCAATALERSPLLDVAAQERLAASAASGEARAAGYPTLGLRAAASRWQNHAFLPGGLDNPSLSSTIGPTEDWSAGGFARYLLYDGGARRAGVGTAEARESAAALHGEAARQRVVFATHQAFCQLAVALELELVASNALSGAEAHLRAARNRRTAGATTDADVLRAQVAVDNAMADLIRARTAARVAAGDLNAVMGLPAETPLAIDPAGEPPGPAAQPDSVPLADRALEARPEVRAARSALEAASRQVQAAEAAFGPRVYADANYGWRDDSSSLSDEAWAAGLTVELTAFEGFSCRSRLARARAEAARARADLDESVLAVRREVWEACARTREAEELLSATETQVRDGEESLRLTAARYDLGAATVTDLLDAQTALTAAHGRRVQARWGCRLARSALQRATGTLAAEGMW